MGTNELLSVPYALMAPDDGDWEIGAYGSLENVQKEWVRIIGNDTLGELMIAPNSTSANHRSQLLLMEDYYGNYGMNLHYDGSDNKFKIFGVSLSGETGPHFVIERESGNIAIGTTDAASGYKLSVDGKVICEELRVELSGSWPDYVFGKEYDLISLIDLEKYIEINHHLPGVPPANQIEESGIAMGEMTKIMMEKVEELTLYLIEANKRISELENKLKVLDK